MKLQEIINQFRIEADDLVEPYLFLDPEITQWLNEAQIEAAIRARLIRERTSPLFTRYEIRQGVMDYPVDPRMYEIVYASLVYKGSDGMLPYIISLTSAEELDQVRPFWRTLPFRPTGIIQYETFLTTDCVPDTAYVINVDGYRLPLWMMDQSPVSETLAQGTLTLTGGSSGQFNSVSVNGIDVLGSPIAYNTSLTQTAADLATQINLNTRMYAATSLGPVLTLTDLVGSGDLHNGYSVSAVSTGITTTATAFSGGISAVVDKPEINYVHHRHLVKWGLHRAFEKPDADTYNPEKSKKAEKQFEDYFGPRPDAANRKRQNASRPHRNVAYP